MKNLSILLVAITVSTLATFTVSAQESQPETSLNSRQERVQIRNESRQQLKERSSEIAEDQKNQQFALRKDLCEQRKSTIQTTINSVSQKALLIQSSLDIISLRIEDYYLSNNLLNEDISDLVNKVDAAKTASDDTITLLSTYVFQLDCTTNETSQKIGTYRAGVSEVNNALNTYRNSLVNLVDALSNKSNSSSQDQ